MDELKLTQFSKGGGCGCKIAPSVLEEMIGLKDVTAPSFANLLVGNESRDDAAVFQLAPNLAVVSTTDFFLPIVDDAFDFGRIASANAISDVYAMGGTPLMAIAILGWPIDKLPSSAAQRVLEGAREICALAGIPLAGGHTIDSNDPIFGLSVTGRVDPSRLKKNNTARLNDLLYLTKPVGVGILSTALKRGVLDPAHYSTFIAQTTSLNKIGAALANISRVNAMTDVTGFGLMGHLSEICDGSGLGAEIYYSRIRKIDGLSDYLKQRTIPDATPRNWNSYSQKVKFEKGVDVMEAFSVLPDPQTNGGLLIAVSEDSAAEVEKLFDSNGLSDFKTPIGKLVSRSEKSITVLP